MQDSRFLQMRIQVLGDVKLNCWYFLMLQRKAVLLSTMVEGSKRQWNTGVQNRSSEKLVTRGSNCHDIPRETQLSQHNLLDILPQLAKAEAAVPVESMVIMYETYRFSKVVYSIFILLSACSIVALHCQSLALHHSQIFRIL